MSKFREVTISTKVVYNNTRITTRCNALTILNTGDDTATLNHDITLLPGMTLTFSGDDPLNVIRMEWIVQFEGKQSNKRLEFVLTDIHDPELAHYVDQPKRKRW